MFHPDIFTRVRCVIESESTILPLVLGFSQYLAISWSKIAWQNSSQIQGNDLGKLQLILHNEMFQRRNWTRDSNVVCFLKKWVVKLE